jgi:hypothetical protein
MERATPDLGALGNGRDRRSLIAALGQQRQDGGADADWKALDWHMYLWDPWFLIVGLLVWAALNKTAGRVRLW